MNVAIGVFMEIVAVIGLATGTWILQDAWSLGQLWPVGVLDGGYCLSGGVVMALWGAWFLRTP